MEGRTNGTRTRRGERGDRRSPSLRCGVWVFQRVLKSHKRVSECWIWVSADRAYSWCCCCRLTVRLMLPLTVDTPSMVLWGYFDHVTCCLVQRHTFESYFVCLLFRDYFLVLSSQSCILYTACCRSSWSILGHDDVLIMSQMPEESTDTYGAPRHGFQWCISKNVVEMRTCSDLTRLLFYALVFCHISRHFSSTVFGSFVHWCFFLTTNRDDEPIIHITMWMP